MPDYPNGKEPDLKSGDGREATAGSSPVSGASILRSSAKEERVTLLIGHQDTKVLA